MRFNRMVSNTEIIYYSFKEMSLQHLKKCLQNFLCLWARKRDGGCGHMRAKIIIVGSNQ